MLKEFKESMKNMWWLAVFTSIVSILFGITTLFMPGATLLTLIVLVFIDPEHLSVSQFTNLSISGFIGLVFGDTFLFKSYEYNGARISSLIMSVAPAIAAFLAYVFLHESLSLLGVIGMGVTLLGIGLVVLSRQESFAKSKRITGLGIFYAFLGAFGQGGGLITAKLALDESYINGVTATLIRIIASLVILLPVAILTGRYMNPVKVFTKDTKSFGLTALGAILGPCLGITFSLISIAHTSIGVSATIMATVPILMLPLVKIIYRETLSWRAYAGAIISVFGVAILFIH